MEDAYFSWAQWVIATGVAAAVLAAMVVSRGCRLIALASLPAGAAVGIVCFFVGLEIPHGAHLDDDVRVFLIAAVIGLVTVIGWLAWVIRRSQRMTSAAAMALP